MHCYSRRENEVLEGLKTPMRWKGPFFAPNNLLCLGLQMGWSECKVCTRANIIFDPKFNLEPAEIHLLSAVFIKVAVLLSIINNYLVAL
jgi:hypothetical protein